MATAVALLASGAALNASHHKGRDRPQSAHLRRQHNQWNTVLHLAVAAVVTRGASLALINAIITAGHALHVPVWRL